jgi:AcrR family transcriptional regulator
MKRTVKAPDARRKEIIEVSKNLFATNGYTTTSIEQIISKAGIAKGTFYYYFKSKKELLSAIVDETLSSMELLFSDIADKKDLCAIDKLKLMLRGPEKEKTSQSSAMKSIHLPENRELQENLNINAIKVISPVITKVVIQGNQEGVFNALYPEESVQILMSASLFLFDSGLFDWSPEKQLTLLKSFQQIFEKALNADEGALSFIAT